MKRSNVAAGAIISLLLLAGCGEVTAGSGAVSTEGSSVRIADLTPTPTPSLLPSALPTPDNFIATTDVGTAERKGVYFEFAVQVDNPSAVAEFSSTVVAGVVTGIESAVVDSQGFINTNYEVLVTKSYKGVVEPGQTIVVSLSGGSMPLGDYIAALDAQGIYDETFTYKSDEFWADKGYDSPPPDPRTVDPQLPVTHNFGSNPASRSLLETIDPDSWVFFLGEFPDGTYYGTVVHHSLMYLKDGYVRSLFPGPDPEHATSVEESKLVE